MAAIVTEIAGAITVQQSAINTATAPGDMSVINTDITTNSECSGIPGRIDRYPANARLTAVMTMRVYYEGANIQNDQYLQPV